MSDEIIDFKKAKQQMAYYIKEAVRQQKPGDVLRLEIKIHPVDEIAWISAQEADVKVFGANQDNTACIAGVGEAACVSGKRISSLKKIFIQLRRYLRPQYPYLQWYGGFCFSDIRFARSESRPKRQDDSSWESFGAYRFILPRFELASNDSSMIFCCNIIGKPSAVVLERILNELNALKEAGTSSSAWLKVKKREDIPSIKEWEKNVASVLASIKKKRIDKVVLARKTRLIFEKPLDAWELLRRMFEVTPNSYHFCFQFKKTSFLGASPERLYRKFSSAIISEAIAGTAPRGQGVSQDNALKVKLLASIKDNHEHAFVVSAIDKGLKSICEGHTHAPSPRTLTLGNGHHLVTSFEGKLKKGVMDEDIIKVLHPTPAVGGVPQDKAVALLRKLEAFERGWYTGLIGYVGYDWSEFVVGIRSGLVKGNELTVYAGAGIVEGSDAQSEWQEIENKISNFIKVIQ